ncbi:IS1182 family transposase [Lentibacillus cibarius]|uniref:IS1182 family transposase n=1 Tax=Lentibacillus cibarius TaxID=2583219 RepID=A0A5S3QJE9_9BACI|nr:IS1182 family transposase [Lentibacillus cibarius]RYG71034.1 IS1182 family transposase [Lentibacillus lipolyticus]TMN22060.1 IS1182 family transposase [Lentibacillus cibarius]
MLERQPSLPLSAHDELYEMLIPEDNFLRQMKELVDFHFIEDELKDKYCLDNGRNAESPVRMFKYLLLKQIYDLSDADLVERARYDLSFKYFLDLVPEASVIHSSSLTKFRRLRLQDKDLMDMLVEKTVALALEHDVLKSNSIIVDATHTTSRFHAKTAREYVQEKSKLLRKTVYKHHESLKEKFPAKPTTDSLEEELTYTNAVINVIEKEEHVKQLPAVKEKINMVKEVIEDIEEEADYGGDPDARKGYKAADYSFLGYKTHIAMSDERIITAAVVTSGEKSDTNYLSELIENTEKNGVVVDTVIGDTAYSSKNNLNYVQDKGMQLVSPLHPVITNGKRGEDKGFEFNKDADMYVCPAGHLATKKAIKKRQDTSKNAQLKYYFDVEKCKVCPLRAGCYKEGAKTKTYSVTVKSTEHLAQESFQETEEFKRLARERYKIEAKNSELKYRHGFKNANSSGLFGMKIQGAATIFVANMKRIIKLMNEN